MFRVVDPTNWGTAPLTETVTRCFSLGKKACNDLKARPQGASERGGLLIERSAMSMRILGEQLNGETLDLEVTAEMTMEALKEHLKRVHTWEDELSRETAVVELIIGDKKVVNDKTVTELGLCDGSKVTVVFRKNVVQCLDKSGFGPDLDPDALVIVEIPDSETEIKAGAFEDCGRLNKVIIPRSVTQIGDHAFQNCSALTEVIIPDSITHIGFQAFRFCRSLEMINIPESVTHIGGEAFQYCSSLVWVNIPDSVTQLGALSFDFCSQLTLRAPMRLLGKGVSQDCKMVPKKCGCGQCDWTRFRDGLPCKRPVDSR